MFFLLNYFREWLSKSIEHRIRFYALALALVIIFIFTTLSYLSLRYVLTLNIKQNLNHELNLNANTLNIIFETITSDIDKISKSSFVSSGLVDSAGRESYLKPFFRDYKNNFDISTNLILVDFMGEPIIANTHLNLINYQKTPEIEKSLLGKDGIAKIIDNGKELLLIKPIIFARTGYTEGAIVATVNLNSILNVIKKSVNKNYRVELYNIKNKLNINDSIINSKKFFSNQKIITLPTSFTSLEFLFKIGLSKKEAFSDLYLMNTSFAIATIIILILVFFATAKIAKSIVIPIKKLTDTAKYISEFGKVNVQMDESRMDEIGELSKIFNLMLKKLDETYEAKSRNEKLLIQQSKMAEMGEMMGAIAHQWRQPLNALGIIVQKIKFLYKKEKLSEIDIDNIQQKAMKQIHFMSKTIDDFRDFFKPNKAKEDFCIYEAIEEVINILSAQFRVHNISTIICVSEYGNIKVLGYKNEFKQVILNILNNSKDAILEKQKNQDNFNGKIKINISEDKNNLITEIKDNAGGIAPMIIDKIFNPYFTTKEQGEGTGIGLYMSKMIIENNMNGSLEVENIDNGVCFRIKLVNNVII